MFADTPMKFAPALVILVLIIGAGIWFGVRTSDQQPPRPLEKTFLDDVASLSFVDYQGNSVSLEAFRGKPFVVNSWAVWCPFCKEELPDFARLQEEFGNELTVIAVNRKESRTTSQTYTDELGISDTLLFLLDDSDALYQLIGGFSMPETLFVDGEGNLVVHKRGFMTLEEMRMHAQKIIQ